VQKRLNRSICHLGCGLHWAEGCTSSIVFAWWRQCALMGGHITATWRIRLNHPSVVAMCLMSNYFDRLISFATPTETVEQIAYHFELKTVLWAFYTIQPSSFYRAPQCLDCKCCTSYSNSVRLSVCLSILLSVTCRHCVKMTAHSTVQFALSDGQMYLGW